MFERGCSYDQLKDSYVIFINNEDPFKKGYPIYTIRNKCLEDDTVEYDDGTTKIFVNASSSYDILNKELEAFLNYLSEGNADSNLTHRIDEKILEAKKNAGWKGDFMTLYEHYQIERAEGRAEGRAESVDTLMETTQMTLEQACEALKITLEEYKSAKNAHQ